MTTITCDLLGTGEVLLALGIDAGRLSRWRRLGVLTVDGNRIEFPKPVFELLATPVWTAEQILPLAPLIRRRA